MRHHEAFADYKKDRRPMPDDLAIQLPLVNEVLKGVGIPVIGPEQTRMGYGAIDVGGLIMSQMLTLFTTPVTYMYLDKLRLRGREKQTAAEAARA